MIHGLTMKEFVEEEKTKLAEMTKEEKKEYFKDYYLKNVIIAGIILVLLIWLMIDIGLNMRHSVVTGGVVNLELSNEGSSFLKEDYMKYLKLGSLTNKVDLAPDIFLDKEEPQSYTLFQAELATNTYNYLITDETGLGFVAGIECLADLDKTLEGELSQMVSDKKVYRKLGESETEIAAAIDITDTAFTKNYVKSGDKVYYIISGDAEDYDSAINMLKYILEKK